ncbi:hypothetical protein BPO_0935 [Bergeyella porcorum]|uniref:Uncharacterized protein n=1 Tax=Bergeyella porcorum TaxID=1735111 RepID=A0AAU0F1W3_9FLAO
MNDDKYKNIYNKIPKIPSRYGEGINYC